MDSSKIKTITIIAVASFLALYLGVAAATAQTAAIAWVVCALGIVFVLSLGKHVWILIPIMLPMVGMINAIPGAPSPWWAAMAIVFTIYMMRFLMRRTEFMVWRFTWLDFAILLQVIAVAQAYVRNPTGILLMGGEMAGGKPYFIFGFAFMAYALLSVTKTDLRMIRWAMILAIFVSVLDSSLLVLSQIVPIIGAIILPLYSNVVFGTSTGNQLAFEAEVGRLDGGKEVGQNMGLALFSIFPPLSCINPLHLFRFIMTMVAVSAILLSGFRSAVGLLMIYFVVGCLIRRQFNELVVAAAAAIVAMILLVGSGLTTKLPYGAQRVLSPLPFVQVDNKIRMDAEGSTDFRVEMWVLALTTDRYIKNKFLGDGFGLSAVEQRSMLEAVMGDKRAQTQGGGIDDFMARGSYHGFHVETIRFTGYFGLALALITLGIFFKQAMMLIRHFKYHKEWGYIIYICMPYLIYPFYYMLVFGSYRTAFPLVLATAGMMKILDNIRVRELSEARTSTPSPSTGRNPVQNLPRGGVLRPAVEAQ